MKVGMIVISNRPDDLEEFLHSMSVMKSFRSQFGVYCLLQDPFTGHEPFLRSVDKYNIVKNLGAPIPFAYYRRMAMKLCRDVDWFWSLDDDHRFQDSIGKMFNKSCVEYYNDVWSFLRSHEDVGVLSCRGYFGGYSTGYDFVINPDNGLVATDKGGLFLRNIGVDKIVSDEESHMRGALFESLAAYNIMDFGLKFARRYNSPIHSRPPGKNKRQGISQNVSYSDETLNNNLQKYIRDKFDDPTWTHSSKRYPARLRAKLQPKKVIHT